MFNDLKYFVLFCICAHTASIYAAPGKISGHIGALSNQINEQVGDVPGNRYNADFNFDYHKTHTTEYSSGLEGRFNFSGLYNDNSLAMFSLQEAYIGGKLSNKDHIKVGRQILTWSIVDETWGFGKLNNRKNFDYFEPGQEGLLGMSYQRKSTNNMRYSAFASILYVPEMNPAMDIDNNKNTITSRHPWAEEPARSAEVETKQKRIEYDVDVPKTEDVVRRTSFGANIGMESKHWVFDNFFMRKPENQISTRVGVQFNAVEDVIKAYVRPQFYYHDVIGSSLKYRNADLEMYVSGISSKPNTLPDVDDTAVRQTEIKTKKYREDYVGGGISKINDIYGMGFAYVARLSNYDRDKEDLSIDPRWNQAVNVFLSRRVIQKINLSTDVKYDMLTNDRLAMFKATYLASKELLMSVGVNLIGTPEDGKSFWSPYTNNDSFYASLRYLF